MVRPIVTEVLLSPRMLSNSELKDPPIEAGVRDPPLDAGVRDTSSSNDQASHHGIMGERGDKLRMLEILRDMVWQAEDKEPGGLEGGPGDLCISSTCMHIEQQLGRPLAKPERQWVGKSLTVVIMQLDQPCVVLPNLMCGNFYCAVDVDVMAARGVTRIVNMCIEERLHPPLGAYKTAGIECGHFPLSDQVHQAAQPSLERALAFLAEADKAGHISMVHCEYGVSRTGLVVVGWLMTRQHLTMKDALALARQGRPQINPNQGFWRELVRYEATLFPDVAPSLPSEGCAIEGLLLVHYLADWQERWVQLRKMQDATEQALLLVYDAITDQHPSLTFGPTAFTAITLSDHLEQPHAWFLHSHSWQHAVALAAASNGQALVWRQVMAKGGALVV
mmetsp:Transcript_52583/g.87277  ORF Transcript_52583/g.87277 Transcript_52583/m.87277 type:complete len:391 (+) Transcript_52583:89-1261(+)|eukprot:CAMPEP_0119307572 /NCGR_PEP_ID=MMETSP1333-20130426/8032_1 /TAXON_ID=418940 /ORGANISM="Scyphosphaera apsteinii, Strain RCC1455" /LENGTH=390 /DNA_ID=CAMNT_0007311147 /DNA_START=139 /DNA_END=1311 /DNA_ORIENTATION=-